MHDAISWIEAGAATHVGKVRRQNEDNFLVATRRGLWAVADGMGGHHAGDVASAMVVDALSRLPEANSFENYVGKAVGALEDVNRAISGLQGRNGGFSNYVIVP